MDYKVCRKTCSECQLFFSCFYDIWDGKTRMSALLLMFYDIWDGKTRMSALLLMLYDMWDGQSFNVMKQDLCICYLIEIMKDINKKNTMLYYMSSWYEPQFVGVTVNASNSMKFWMIMSRKWNIWNPQETTSVCFLILEVKWFIARIINMNFRLFILWKLLLCLSQQLSRKTGNNK